MKARSKGSLLLAIVFAVSMVLAACSGGDSSSGGDANKDKGEDNGKSGGDEMADKQVLNFAADADIPSLDIHQATDALSFEVDYEIFGGLMRLDKDEEPVPDMAESKPDVNDDKTVYTFKIRDDAKWSDGNPVTAQNFVDAWKRDVDPDFGGDYAYIFESAFIKNAEKIMDEDSNIYGDVDKLGAKATDKKTLKVTLEKPTPYFVNLMTFPPFYPIEKDVVDENGDDFATAPDKMVYNGPFKLKEWQHGESWTLEKNDDYWNADKVKLDEVDYKVVKDASARMNLYKTKKLDYANLTSEFVDQFKDDKGFKKGELTSTMYYLKLNQKKNKALQNDDIREAIYNGFDREGLTEGLKKNGAEPAYYFVPKDYIKGPDDNDFREADPEINKKSLDDAQASWKKGLEEIGEDKVTLELLTTDGSDSKKEGVYLQEQLEKNLPGLKVKLNRQPSGSFFEKRGNFEYDLALSDWIPDFRDPMTYLENWTTGNSSNESGYSDKQYDKLIKKAQNQGDEPDKRMKTLQDAEKLLLEESGIVPLYQEADAYVKQPYVHEMYDRTASGINYTQAYITKH